MYTTSTDSPPNLVTLSANDVMTPSYDRSIRGLTDGVPRPVRHRVSTTDPRLRLREIRNPTLVDSTYWVTFHVIDEHLTPDPPLGKAMAVDEDSSNSRIPPSYAAVTSRDRASSNTVEDKAGERAVAGTRR